jgi:acyl dehydratase
MPNGRCVSMVQTAKSVRALRLSPDIIGSAADDSVISWDDRDTLLYALGVGAGLGAPERELHFTTENSEDAPFAAIPSLLSVLLAKCAPPALLRLPQSALLHAEQGVELPRVLPPGGTGLVRSRVQSILDKGDDALIVVAAELYDYNKPSVIGRSLSSIYVRGGGGFGGERGLSAAWDVPLAPPDRTVNLATRPEQALIYRLSGDHHRLHSDPTFARSLGFAGPILHGLATYGFACRALVQEFCSGDPGSLRTMSARFASPVIPGDSLTMHLWLDGNTTKFQMVNQHGTLVLDRGIATRGSPHSTE